jgi:hypothetical protein
MYFISIIAGYSPFYNNSAEKNAIVEINKDNIKIEQLINERYDDLTEVKESIIDKSSHNAIVNVLNTYIGSEQFGDLRFFSNGKIYDANGLEVNNEYAEIKAFEGLNRRAFSGEYIDTMLSKSCVAFYIPITGSANISGLVSIIEARNFINLDNALNENSKALSKKETPQFSYSVTNSSRDLAVKSTLCSTEPTTAYASPLSSRLILEVTSGSFMHNKRNAF